LGGIRFVMFSPRLWPYAVVPLLVMIFLTIGLTYVLLWAGSHVTSAILGEPTSAWARFGGWIVYFLVALTSFLIGAIAAVSLAQPLSCFALEAISELQDFALTGQARSRPSFVISFLTSARVVFCTLLLGGIVLAALFVVSLLFPPAAVVTVPLKLLVCAWLIAW